MTMRVSTVRRRKLMNKNVNKTDNGGHTSDAATNNKQSKC